MDERSPYTHAEHRARAALLGLEYDWRDSTYNDMNATSDPWIYDADTMQAIPPKEASYRREIWKTLGLEMYAPASRDTPKNPKETEP